jgi:starvation-inducible DNA-binding protein
MSKGSKKRAAAPRSDIGLGAAVRREIADGLGRVLADPYMLYLKTHAFHWTVEGPMFNTLHAMFMEQYTELWNAVDSVAERIRALGFPAPGTYREFSALTSIEETPGSPRALQMVRLLVAGHETLARTLRSVFPVAEKASDESTVDLLTQRLPVHETTGWMLRSILR